MVLVVLLLICVSRTQPTQRELFNVRSDFDQAFVSSPAFWWKTLFIALASCVPGACTAPVVLLGRFAHHASHVTLYTSHVTRPHTRHTSHVTRDAVSLGKAIKRRCSPQTYQKLVS